MKKVFLLLFLISCIANSSAQYANKHYIAPSPWQYWSNANEIVISTTMPGNVTVNLKKSNGNAITTLTVTATNPVSYRFVGDPGSVSRNMLNTIASDRGLIVEASEPVSVNMRNIASDSPGTTNLTIKGNASLVSFGNEGIGLAFRLGYYRNSYTGITNGAPIYSVMAIENGTIISLNRSVMAILNAGQSRLFTTTMGSLLTADKPVVSNVGTYGDTPQSCSGNGEDGTVDQIAPVNMLGQRYMLVRGEGTPGTGPNDPEQSTIIASEANTSVQITNYDASGNFINTVTQNLANAGSYITIHHGDAMNKYSSSFVNATKPVVVFSATAVDCETDVSTVLPIGGCAGSTNIITRKFISYNNTDLSYFGYTILESATEPVFINGNNLETVTGVPRIQIGTTGFYMLRFTNVQISNPTVITLTSNARMTTSIIQQGEGFSMSGFFSAFSDSPEPPTEITSTDSCSVTLTTTSGLAPYQWYLEGVAIPGATLENYTATQTGNYTVMGTRDCGRTAPSSPVYITISPCSDLKIEKEVISVSGNQATFKITASNIGNTNDTNVRVTDLLPNGYQFVSATATVGTYNSTTGIWNIGNLAFGATQTLTVIATINSSGNFVNVATISGTNTDTNPTNNTDQAIAQTSTLTLTKVARQTTYYNLGDVILYDLVLTNSGHATISNITITDTNADAGSVTPSSILQLVPRQSVTITASHTITASDITAGNVSNQAVANGQNTLGDPVTVLSDNPATPALNDPTIVSVVSSADLVTVKTNNQTVYVPGTTTVYTITITNNGPSDALNVNVNDAIPAGISNMTWSGNGSSGTGNLNDVIPILSNGNSIVYQVSVVIPNSFTGNLTNTVLVSSDVPDPNPICNQCTDVDTECSLPTIQNPTPLLKCDDAVSDGLTVVNLNSKTAEITRNDTTLEVHYYLNATTMASGIRIADYQNFQTTIPYSQQIIAVVNNASGCSTFVALEIKILGKPQPTLVLDKKLCEIVQNEYAINSYETEILNGETGTTVTGYFATLNDAENNRNAILNTANYPINSVSKTIFIRIENGAGCFEIATLRLTILPTTSVRLKDKYAVCFDSNGVLVSQAVIETGLSPLDFTFKWYKNGLLLSNTNSNLVTSEIGNYSVEISNSSGCPSTTASTVVVLSNGTESFSATLISGYFSDNATIFAQATGNGNFVYWLDEGATQNNGYFYNVSRGTHYVHVKDADGCGNILTKEITIIDYPKFFTPNGDSYNDYWNIWDLKDQKDALIYIFDRYGKLLTSIKPSGAGWDGKFNGNTLPSTDYWFKVIYKENENLREFKAHFSLKR